MKRIIIILQVVLIFGSCAKIGSPTGGPKDEIPPAVVLSTPRNYSTNFNAKKVEIEFNEYVELKDIRTNLIVSPPFNEDPYTRVKGKGIVFDIKDTLVENTTYTINFGNAIVDFREGNAIENFEYVFSTGQYLDSLTVSGKIVNAFDLQVNKEPFFVMLYTNLSDSAPLLEKPLYLGKTDKEGNFSINNIRTDTFRLLALQDANANLIYDLPDEKIAFLDTSFYLSASEIIHYDTIVFFNPDSVNLDSTATDTMAFDSTLIVPVYSYQCNLFSFTQDKKEAKQYLKNYSRNKRFNLNVVFNTEIKDSIVLSPISFSPVDPWYTLESNPGNDTLNYWILDSAIYLLDTLAMAIHFQAKDSLDNFVWVADTTSFRFIEKQATKKDRKKLDKEEPEDDKQYLSVKINHKNKSTIDLNKQLNLLFDNPLSSIDTSNIGFFLVEDTIFKKQHYQILGDTNHFRRYHFINSWIENSNYKLVFEPGAFTDFYGNQNDTLELEYKTQKLDYYGIILLNLTGVEGNVIVQLMDKTEKVLAEKMVGEDSEVIFDYLYPTEYKIKVIHDTNQNGQWDTGNYLENLQPEQVEYYKGEIKIRSNWDLQLNFQLVRGK